MSHHVTVTCLWITSVAGGGGDDGGVTGEMAARLATAVPAFQHVSVKPQDIVKGILGKFPAPKWVF